MSRKCYTNRAEQRFRSCIGHKLRQYNCQRKKYCSYHIGRRISTKHFYSGFSNKFTSAAGVHGRSNRNHTCKQENSYPVNRVICLFFCQATGKYSNNGTYYSSNFQGYDPRCHTSDNSNHNNTANDLFLSAGFVFQQFFFNIQSKVTAIFWQQIFTNKHHIENTCNSNRNTDPGIFKKAELLICHASRF